MKLPRGTELIFPCARNRKPVQELAANEHPLRFLVNGELW
jgi:hypothetical protein